MKKVLISILLGTMVLCSVVPSFAEGTTWDLSSLSFQELIELRRQIDYELWNADEWQEVVVPQGIYEIGVDIPAGHWNITVDPNQGKYNQDIDIVWGEELDASKTQIRSRYVSKCIYGTGSEYYDAGDLTEIDFELCEGTYLSISGGSVIFKPYIGKPALGFK